MVAKRKLLAKGYKSVAYVDADAYKIKLNGEVIDTVLAIDLHRPMPLRVFQGMLEDALCIGDYWVSVKSEDKLCFKVLESKPGS